MKPITFKALENGKILIKFNGEHALKQAKWREANRIWRMRQSGDKYEEGKRGRKKIDPELKRQNCLNSQRRYRERVTKLSKLHNTLKKQGIFLIVEKFEKNLK